ncbi:MAG: hypothetical protein KBC26_01200 [Candidatus Pacebacteria bacterium]|nr:hypothetical protein [Candidatus Paceibacterota bacterium]
MKSSSKKTLLTATAILFIITGLLVIGGELYYFKTKYKSAPPTTAGENARQSLTQTPNQVITPIVSPHATIDQQTGFIKNIYFKNNTYYLDIDYIQWITDEKICRASNQWGEFNNGYCIINSNPFVRTFEIDKNASVFVTTNVTNEGKFDDSVGLNTTGNLTRVDLLYKAFNNESNLTPDGGKFHNLFVITINPLNIVVGIKEQYTP